METILSGNICFFNSTKAWGGGEKWHHEMACYLFEKGYSVTVFTNTDSELFKKLVSTGINVIPVKVSNLSFLNIYRINKLKKIFLKLNFKTIIMNLPADVKFAGLAAKKAKIKNIIYRRGSAIPIKNTFLNRYIFKNIITNILANSEETRKTINQNSNLFPDNKIKVIYNGINLEKFDNSKIQSFYKKSENEIIIGNVGRLEFQKNQKDLIYIAKYLKNKNISFKILIAGSGRLKNELIQLAENENVIDKIIFLDFVDNIKSFMENIDIFALTSFWEGFGYVLTEAMACSKPVVTYDISSNPEIITDNANGFLIEYPDKELFAEKIMFLAENINIRTKFGDNGRKIVEEKFQHKTSAEQFEKYIKSLV